MLEAIRAASPGMIVRDSGDKLSVRGLHVIVGRTGTKVFYLYYRNKQGKERRPKIGAFGEITVSEARKRAKSILDEVAIGGDPSAEWQKSRAELTVQELYEKTQEGYWSKMGSSWATKKVPNFWKNHLQRDFGHLKLSEITPSVIRRWHEPYSFKAPTSGNRALEILSRIFTFAEEQEWRPMNSNPCSIVKAHTEVKRKRYATEEEIQKIAEIMDRNVKRNPRGIAFLYLLMFSGSRPSAIERATWEQLKEFVVDGEKYGMITLDGKSTKKTGEEERVILPPQAMKAISRLPRIEGETITGIKMPRKLWNLIRNEAGCTDLWARDWRRTFATLGHSGGIEIGVIGDILNHKSTQTTKIYAKVLPSVQIKAVSQIANRMEELTVQPDRVVRES